MEPARGNPKHILQVHTIDFTDNLSTVHTTQLYCKRDLIASNFNMDTYGAASDGAGESSHHENNHATKRRKTESVQVFMLENDMFCFSVCCKFYLYHAATIGNGLDARYYRP
jgi:hypothetical protein